MTRLLRYIGSYRGHAVLSVMLAFVVAGLGGAQLPVIIPLFDALFGGDPQKTLDYCVSKLPKFLDGLEAPLQKFLDNTLQGDPVRTLIWALGIFVTLSFLKSIAQFYQSYTVGKIHTGIARRIAGELYEHVLRLSMSFYSRTGTPSMMSRFTNDVEAVGRGLKVVFGKVLIEPLRLVVFLGLAAAANWRLLLINLALFPLVGAGIYIFGKKSRRAMRKGLKSRDGIVNILQETFEGISIVKAFNMESREQDRFDDENNRIRRQDLKLEKVEAATGPLVEFLGILGVAVSLSIAGYWVARKGMSANDVILFYVALLSMSDPVRKLSRVNNRIQMLRAASERVFHFLDETTDVVEKPRARELPLFSGEIRFEKVYFTYNNIDTVLRGVDLVARKGEIIALVGPSGAGKSTIARLIPRFYDPTSGSVSIDGVDLRDVTLRSLRDQIGLVTQEVILFNDTVASNIAYGRPDASLDDITAAARAANAEEFISALPEGYDSMVGEKGLQLSGGQRQRIALARAILKDPPILILDEATSSLDSESEYLIQKALDEFMQDRTSIVIAHRLSTVERASRIYVIDSGEIASAGTNAELLESSPLYKKLHSMQFHTAALDA